ncbi:MAG: serine/threonine protein kinase, partial [Xanthomonadales bacterium]|nr:serine/threonine protein kinase [Xanthomonadales bacterium]
MSVLGALALFEAALALAPVERRAFIERETTHDAALRAAALALLDAHAASEGFLEPAVEPAVHELGAWRLLERIGAGGMGQVWLAERRDGAFEQRVAIKVLAATLGDGEAVRRAEAERQFLAWLDHPNIARVLDGGTTPQGQPFLVMEHVDGEPVDAWCAARALDPKARIGLFLQVLGAVEAAHAALIIHRDIKPANVLVTAQGTVKLLDFGIAKSLDARVRGVATEAGAGPLTPDYASPEQLAGAPLTTACDIYALGLLLHELLTGRRAFERGPLSLIEYAQRVSAHAPTRPSARLDGGALGLAA